MRAASQTTCALTNAQISTSDTATHKLCSSGDKPTKRVQVRPYVCLYVDMFSRKNRPIGVPKPTQKLLFLFVSFLGGWMNNIREDKIEKRTSTLGSSDVIWHAGRRLSPSCLNSLLVGGAARIPQTGQTLVRHERISIVCEIKPQRETEKSSR
jgi:hypothetical protein